MISAFVILDFLSSDLSKKTPISSIIFASLFLLLYKFFADLLCDLENISRFFLFF